MVNIDTVYQRVQALSNKEQRGYITPQEFNLFANQAQMEIFEQYFYDLNQAARTPGNNKIIADVEDMLEEKISIFEVVQYANWVSTNMTVTANGMTIPPEIYRFEKIWYTTSVTINPVAVEIMSFKERRLALESPLAKPTHFRPIGSITSQGLIVSSSPVGIVGSTTAYPYNGYEFEILYIRKPKTVQWAYVIINDKPLYNDNIAQNFELHASEETELVHKILKLAGVNLKAQEIVQVGQALEQTQIQQEKQ